ncbi:MAG: FecR family protein [Chitinophagaceae bacterium]|nr:MAG: FecR family protein [Chitinophagaceae bacterium]
MLLSNDRLDYLFEHYLNNHISDSELTELFGYIRNAERDDLLKDQIMRVFKEIRPEADFDFVDWENMFSGVVRERPLQTEAGIKKISLWKKAAAAVLIIILGGSAGYLFMHHPAKHRDFAKTGKTVEDILPGGNKATLTLSNGTKIILNNANNGKLASVGNVNVIKVNSGSVAYRQEPEKSDPRSKIKDQRSEIRDQRSEINTLQTPRGGQYQLTLSDGTKVWLNAASSIRYPVEFAGNERKVGITGEVYFEVVHKEKMPFEVLAGNKIIEDIGTHFNVNAYADEYTIKTTLLEGAVKIGQVMLKPGEQAVWSGSGKIRVRDHINTTEVIAWKNGLFSFKNDNLEKVMRKLSRWYDVDVIYQPGVDNKQHFTGMIDRNLTLSQVLKGLELTNAHFRIEAGRKVEILP